LSRAFSVSIDIVAWVVLGYALAVSATLLVVGRLATKRGYRFVYVIGFALFTGGSLLCSLAGTIYQLVAFRVIQGVGASFLMASGPALITRAFPVNERGRGLGILGTVVGVGLMTGPPLGGFLITAVSWHAIFLINVPIGIVGVFYCSGLLKIMPPDHPDSKIDYIGGVYQAIGVICLLLFLNRLDSTAWPQWVLYGILAVSVMGFAAFLWRETHAEHPLVGLSIFKQKQFSIAIAAMLLTFICTASLVVLIPFYLEDVLNLLPSQVGLVLVSVPIVTAIAAPLSGRISDAIGYRFLTTFGLVLLFAGLLYATTLDADSSPWDVVLRLVIIGIGAGVFQAPNSTAMMSAVPKRVIGIASGLLAVTRNIGISGGVAVSTALFMYHQQKFLTSMDKTAAFIRAFSWVIMTFSFLVLLAAIISVFRKNRAPDHVSDQ